MKHIQQIYDQAERLYSMFDIEQALEKIAETLTSDYADSNPVFLCVMNGAVMTTGHLMPKLKFPLEFDYIHATRYGDKTIGGELVWQSRPMIDMQHRHVILVEDIYDEGTTLNALRSYCETAGASSVSCVALVNKLHAKKVGQLPEYIGMTVPDRFVFGFGMDYRGYWRNAPGIFAVSETNE